MRTYKLRRRASGAWEILRQVILVGTLGSLFLFAPLHSKEMSGEWVFPTRAVAKVPKGRVTIALESNTARQRFLKVHPGLETSRARGGN